MKLALLGADDESLALVQWAVKHGHSLVGAFDIEHHQDAVQRLAPGVRLSDDWESLLLGTASDAVLVSRGYAPAEEGVDPPQRRADQLRKLAQSAVPLVVVCPACEAIVGFEIEMIRRDVGGVLLPYVPLASYDELDSLRQCIETPSNGMGNVEQIVLERQMIDRSRDAVLLQLARDIGVLRRLVGPIRSVSASGGPSRAGRDPLGPRPKEPPSLANISVHLEGTTAIPIRWSIGPVTDQPGGLLKVVGRHGVRSLAIPSPGSDRLPAEMFARLEASRAEPHPSQTDWLDACRDQEAAEAVDRSLLRGRAIELFNEDHTEEESFKGVMAMGGCLLLLMALGVVLLATVVEGLQLPLRNWQVWRLWPIYLLAPIGVFLLLQLLQLVIKPGGGTLGAMAREDQSPKS